MQFLLWSTIDSWSRVFGSKLTQSPANGFNLPHRASTDTYSASGKFFFRTFHRPGLDLGQLDVSATGIASTGKLDVKWEMCCKSVLLCSRSEL